ncbi:LLM class flavin-dependent oxidoreductase [Streptomyces sp. INA 01156]
MRTLAPYVRERDPAKEIVARIFVMPGADPETARALGRRMITAYLNVPVYRAFHEWLGRDDVLGPMWRAWGEGDRRAALRAVPDEVVDELVIHGPAKHCRERIGEYVDNGVTTPVIHLVGDPQDPVRAVRDLAPDG